MAEEYREIKVRLCSTWGAWEGEGKGSSRGCLPCASLPGVLPTESSHHSRGESSWAAGSHGSDLADGRRPAIWNMNLQDGIENKVELLGLKVFKKTASPTLCTTTPSSETMMMIVMICLVEKALACEVRRPGSSPHSALYWLCDSEGVTLTI